MEPVHVYPIPTPLTTESGGSLMAGFTVWMERQNYSPRTIQLYTQLLHRCQSYLEQRGCHLRAATWKDIRGWADTLPLTYASRSAARSTLKLWAKMTGGEQLHWAIPQPKRPEGRCKAISPDQLQLVLEVAQREGVHEYAAVCAMYYAGLRREETSRMRWEHLLPGGQLRIIGKGLTDNTLPLHPRLAAALADLPRNNVYVHPGRTPGTHVAPATINFWCRIIGAGAGIHLTPHMLRHTSIAAVHDTTGDLRTASRWARHKKVETTMVYTRTTAEKLQGALNAL